ncbi:hypothetical protein [Calidifontibacillus erzurumensis]|uniref:hypothetical protein n=1 Tax=Calidifontibacillus erzurumensis TaxID=2741433 RepID=UPI0035B51F70
MSSFLNFKRFVVTGALSLGVIGAAAFPAFAEANVDKVADDSSQTTITEINIDRDPHKAPLVLKFNWGQDVDEATMKKIQAILDETKAKLEELGVTCPAKFVIGHPFENLDEATKEKVQGIMEKVKSGELSRNEAQKQLEELGIQLPIQGEFIKKGLHHKIQNELKENSVDQSNHVIFKNNRW